MTHLLILFFCVIFCLLPMIALANKAAPPLMLAKVAEINAQDSLQHYWVSEKYDGVRAYWDGQQLLSRRGNLINAPNWFTANLPNVTLEGELWIGRDQFDLTSGIIRKQRPIDEEWQNIKFIIFDLPQSQLSYIARQKKIASLIHQAKQSWLIAPNHFQVTNTHELDEALTKVLNIGGEGLMLNLANASYQVGRSSALLKLKPYFDAEAKVLKHIAGKGKFKDMLGALLVRSETGKVFKIGTGFSQFQRENPPEIGDTITYKYSGLTKNGVPRFASFLRTRREP